MRSVILKEFDRPYLLTENADIYYWKGNKWHYGHNCNGISKSPNDKYKHITVIKNGKKYYPEVHRLVAKYFVDGYFDGAVVNHKDCNKHNNRSTNLEWITQKENIEKSYTNDVSATKHYHQWIIIGNDFTSNILNGYQEVKRCITNNNLDVSMSSLIKYKESKGYKLVQKSDWIIVKKV